MASTDIKIRPADLAYIKKVTSVGEKAKNVLPSGGASNMPVPWMAIATAASAVAGGLAAYAGKPPVSAADRLIDKKAARFGGHRFSRRGRVGPGPSGRPFQRERELRKRILTLLADVKGSGEKGKIKRDLRNLLSPKRQAAMGWQRGQLRPDQISERRS